MQSKLFMKLLATSALFFFVTVSLIFDSPGVEGAHKIEHDKHHSMLHNHMSRKVFDRACAASKDVIDEIILCVTDNKDLMANMNLNVASTCYRNSFGVNFDVNDITKHKDLICKQRDKFEDMVACVYHEVTANATEKVIDQLTSALVDVGLCIINAIDG